MGELKVGDEVEVVCECDIKGKRGKIIEITYIFTVEIEGKKEIFARSDSLKKIMDELQVGDEVEVVYEGNESDKGKRGKIAKIERSHHGGPYVYTVDVNGTTHRYGCRDSLRKIPKDTCICDRIFLFNNGCKCGHWEREKNGNSKSKHSSLWQQALKRLPGSKSS